ncbi:phosphatases II [Neoconidiobolus thromboides FSU 785]|nr:phosphatases II [Neoconidiobolus thromboides FSU 785]
MEFSNSTNNTNSINTNWLKPQKNVYENGPIEMLPNFYLGDETNASNGEILSKYNIGFVLNVAREVENELLEKSESSYQFVSNDQRSLYLKKSTFIVQNKDNTNYSHTIYSKKLFWDHNPNNLIDCLDSAFNFIELAKSLNAGILIHCQCGVSRSASLVIAYIMKTLKFKFDQSYQYVKSRSNIISPNLSLITQLIEFEKKMNLNQHHYDYLPQTPALTTSFTTSLPV